MEVRLLVRGSETRVALGNNEPGRTAIGLQKVFGLWETLEKHTLFIRLYRTSRIGVCSKTATSEYLSRQQREMKPAPAAMKSGGLAIR